MTHADDVATQLFLKPCPSEEARKSFGVPLGDPLVAWAGWGILGKGLTLDSAPIGACLTRAGPLMGVKASIMDIKKEEPISRNCY